MGLFRLNPRVLERLAMKRILDTEQLNIIGPALKKPVFGQDSAKSSFQKSWN